MGDVYQALVGAHLKLLAGILINERRTIHRVFLDFRGQRHRTDGFAAVTFDGIDDLGGGLINDLIIVSLELDPDALAVFCFLCGHFFL